MFALKIIFSPRLRMERLSERVTRREIIIFQSTLPLRGATRAATKALRAYRHFNPRSPCGERRANNALTLIIAKFQSTLPVRGATANYGLDIAVYFKFQSTLPVRGSDCIRYLENLERQKISIHAPRAGSDEGIIYMGSGRL